MKKLIIIMITLFLATILFGQPSSKGTLKIKVKHLKNDHGQVKLVMFNNKEYFLKKPEKSVYETTQKIEEDREEVLITIDDLQFGDYAIVGFHDENGDDKMDKNFLGIPKEGIGLSNGARPKFGPPKYGDAKFNFKKDGMIIEIEINY